MLNKLKKTDNKGFTIIEVLIVLAIAGLILLIVFLAVPALQRAQRNSARKSDAGHFSTSINDFISNNNGTLPRVDTAAHWQADCGTIQTDAGTLSQFSTTNIDCAAAVIGTGTVGEFDAETGSTAALTGLKGNALVLDEAATCPTTVGGNPSTTNVNSNQYALFYTFETGSGNWTWDCISS